MVTKICIDLPKFDDTIAEEQATYFKTVSYIMRNFKLNIILVNNFYKCINVALKMFPYFMSSLIQKLQKIVYNITLCSPPWLS